MRNTVLHLIATLLVALTTVATYAVRPLRIAMTARQSDGSTIVVYKEGETRLGITFHVTVDDIAVVKNAKGDFCYASLVDGKLEPSEVVAHDAVARSDEEKAWLASNGISAQRVFEEASSGKHYSPVNRTTMSLRPDGLGTYGQTAGGAVPSVGTPTLPVIMVEFSDVSFMETTTVGALDSMFNLSEGAAGLSIGSVKNYFRKQSNGMFEPSFDIVCRVRLDNTRAYYGANSSSGAIDPNNYTFITQSVAKAVSQGADLSRYDDGNGVPLVVLLYAGLGEADSYERNSEDFLWPCEIDINTTLSGQKIRSVFLGNEERRTYTRNAAGDTLSSDPKLAGIGIFCHEFGHALGLPDFYCTNYTHRVTPLGIWDIMDMGQYLNTGNGTTYSPIGYTAYEKNFCGWLEIPELESAGPVTISPYGSTQGPSAFLVRNPSDDKEYYIFENRQPDTWYPAVMGRGLLSTHVAYNETNWKKNNLNNTASKLRMTVFAADGQVATGSYRPSNAHYSDLFPGYTGNSEITDETTVCMSVFTGSTIDKPIYNIALRQDSLVTFNAFCKVDTLKLDKAGYATYYTTQAFELPEGLEAGVITGVEEDTLIVEYRYAAGAVVPGRTAIVLRGDSGSYQFTSIPLYEGKTAPADNLLCGGDFAHIPVMGTSHYYLANAADSDQVGLYLKTTDAADAHEAYLSLQDADKQAYLFKYLREVAAADNGVLYGDVDNNGLVNVTDVTTLINYILGANSAVFNVVAADITCNSAIDVADVTSLVNIILSN